MGYSKLLKEENGHVAERYGLAMERIRTFLAGETQIEEPFLDYFVRTASFLQMMDELKQTVDKEELKQADFPEMQEYNRMLYRDILAETGAYEKSYANPAYAVKTLGRDYGQLLSFLYAELRGDIVYAVEQRLVDLTIHAELFVQVLCLFEEENPPVSVLKETLSFFVSDYADLTIDYRVREILDSSLDFATDIVMKSNLADLRYLFRYGEYITDNEIRMAEFLNSMEEEEIEKMAYTFTHGYEEGFRIAGIDLSKKKTVNIRYAIGQERMVRAAIRQFRKMGLEPVIYRSPIARINRKGTIKTGYCGTSANKQYEYDHRGDDALFLTKAFVKRKTEVLKNAYESRKQLAGTYAGPAVIEVFGEKPFEPVNKSESLRLSDEQQKLSVQAAAESAEIVNTYIPQSEYSFTIIAYPVPEIGNQFEEIFAKIVEVNTLDNTAYQKVQQTIIDELDKAVTVRVLGKGNNKTDMLVQMHDLEHPDKETNFENCTADVNIPLGEVFTSPMLTGTKGKLNVSEVYLNELKFKNLLFTFEEGKIVDYTCDNFSDAEENRAYIKENILFNRDTLPIGEFAIGTNTTAYVMANAFDIVYQLPILIVEKMGPHFAVGDTCYSHSEEIRLYNPDGKEIVAKDNECSRLRDTDGENAYFNCHTDITIPYDEIARIISIHQDGTEVEIIRDGRFVLAGCDMLNEPFNQK
ncbi:MAG: aminopeptidase [Bacteroidales bacterium]|nr:aminopeptidase [Clostridium sp.]MCM1204076.1 aminopeptidase [Bacteroidales bacterium]